MVTITRGIAWLSTQETPTLLTWIGGAAAMVSGFALLLGLLTPGVGVLVAVTGLAWLSGWIPTWVHPPPDLHSTSLFVVVALAVGLLGPGAYSLDAYLFGRREIVIPEAPGTRDC